MFTRCVPFCSSSSFLFSSDKLAKPEKVVHFEEFPREVSETAFDAFATTAYHTAPKRRKLHIVRQRTGIKILQGLCNVLNVMKVGL